MEQHLNVDVVIAGAGIGGLYTAINLPEDKKILMICKDEMKICDSMLAQGGISVLRDENDYDAYFEDTMRAGHYENRKESVEIMIRGSRAVIDHLVEIGVPFNRTPDGELQYTKEGAHSAARICFYKDITGQAITETLQSYVKELSNVTILENTTMKDILVENDNCTGILAETKDGDTLIVHAKDTVLVTGGIGGLYEHTTNYPSLTGDALTIARKHGICLEHMDYVQFHPTSLYRSTPGRSFLITESARGEGAILLNGKGERFTDELQPRDVVSNAILTEMKKEGSKHVWLSFERVQKEEILSHFPNIYKKCLEEGFDILKEPIPVVPAQHYFMGGIHVDSDSKTTMEHLFAVGETSCNGVHGKNRLASNSLLESFVFAKRAAEKIAAGKEEV